MVNHNSLYTQGDIKKIRDQLSKEQQGIDPILNEAFFETQVLDHDHKTQRVRAVLNRNVNAFEGLVYNAYLRCIKWVTDKPLPEVLRGLADYLEVDYSNNPYHPSWMKSVKSRFNKLNSKGMSYVLTSLGKEEGKNVTERKKLFASLLLDRNLGYYRISEVLNSVENRIQGEVDGT